MTPDELRRHRAEKQREWRARNPERAREIARQSYQKNRDARLAKASERRSDPEVRDRLNRRSKEWYHANVERARSTSERWRKEHPDRAQDTIRRSRLRALGTTPEAYDALFVEQDGACAICREPCKSGRRLAVDHDHETGVVRGLLCMNCNNALGKMNDSAERLQAAVEYLKRKR